MNGASANVVKRQRVTLRKEIRDGVVSFVDIFSAKEVDLLKKDHAGLLHNDDDGYDDDLKANGVDVFWEPLDSDDEYDSDDEVDSSDSDDSGTEDEGEDNADSFDEVDYANVSEDIQFLAGKAVDEENPGYKGPSTSSGDWDRRNVAREAFIKETREVESQMKTMLSSFRANSDMSPECFYCGRAALTICHDCSANGRYACQEHFCMTISQSTVHNVSEEDAGGGLKPTIVPVRSWRCENCSFCLASFFRYPPDDTSSYTVSVHTSRSGVVKVCVTAQRCSQCDCISGESASEFGCTPGAKYVWFTNDFMHANRRMYVANGFRVSTYAQFKAKLDADADRGSFNGSSAVYQSFSAASRIFTALLDDLRSLSTRGGNAPPIENLGSCPACANGYHSVNGDACMKLRVASRNAKSAALPLPTHDNFFGPNALTDHGKVLDLTMEAMRNCLKKRESSPATENGYSGPQPLPPLLSSGLCSSNFRAAQGEPTSSAKSATENKRLKAYAITGVFAATCGHGMAIKPSCRMIDTPGERYEFTQLTIECMYHLCGLVPNPKVFGPVPSGTKTRPPRFLISDLACKMHPRLKKQSPWVLEFTDLALGNVHEFAHHQCRKMFSLRGKRGSGRVDGEGVERFWSLVVGAAFSGERKTTAHFLESIRDVFLSANAKLLSGIPNMLSRAAQRAFQALLQKIDELISLLIELDLHGFQLNDDVIEDWNSSLSGADVNASHVITPQAAYFGILEELETKKKLKATLEMTRLYSGQSEALSLKKITRSIKQLEKSAKDLCRQVGSGYQPTLEDKADFRKAAIAKLNVEIMQKEADLCLAKMSVQRGSNSLKHLHPSEKARNREAIENMKFVLGELKTKLSLHLSRSEPKTSSMNDSRTGLPTLVKMKVVGCYNAAKRCAEALGYLIPQELKCFIDTCSKRAAGLRGAASVIQAPSRLEFSEAALFYQRANYFDSLAAHGRAVQNVLVGIPSLASTAVHLFPWIELSLRKAATPPVPFESDEVLTSPVSEEVSCALLNCGCDAAQGLVLCKLVTQPVPRGQSTLKGSLPISSNTTSAFSTATIEVRDDMEPSNRKGDDRIVLFWPPVRAAGTRAQMILTFKDLRRLNPGQFLNDNIVDLQNELVHKCSSKVAVLSALLYSKAIDENFETPVYAGLARLGSMVPPDLFERMIVCIPITGFFHFSTIAVCNLDVLSKQAFGVLGQELLVEEFTPCVLHLDSLKDSCLHNSDLIAAILRPFLIDVWRKFCERRFPKETLENAEVRMAIDRAVSLLRRLPILSPNVRQQVNLVDCGLHTLANIEDLVAKQPRITASDLSSNPPCGLHFYEKDPNHRCRVQTMRSEMKENFIAIGKEQKERGGDVDLYVEV